MTSYHTIANNLRSNEWTYNKELGVWTNKHGYNVNCTETYSNPFRQIKRDAGAKYNVIGAQE